MLFRLVLFTKLFVSVYIITSTCVGSFSPNLKSWMDFSLCMKARITTDNTKSEENINVSKIVKSHRIRPQGKPRDSSITNPNRLRIIAGLAKGKKIESPDVYLRPMMAKVREALFSSLESLGLFDSNSINVLDVFSGSGSVGLEALSRGAANVTFVDFSPLCISTALNNAESMGFKDNVKGICAKAEEFLQDSGKFSVSNPFQLITITPPYQEVVYEDLIMFLCKSILLQEDTLVVIEYPIEMQRLPYILHEKLYGIRNRKYGRTVLATYVYRPTRSYDMRPSEFLM